MASASSRRRRGFKADTATRGHRRTIDETAEDGGGDAGPTPTELLAASLASCAAITLEMYADRKGWDIGAVEVDVDWPDAVQGGRKIDVSIRIPAELTDEQRERLLV